MGKQIPPKIYKKCLQKRKNFHGFAFCSLANESTIENYGPVLTGLDALSLLFVFFGAKCWTCARERRSSTLTEGVTPSSVVLWPFCGEEQT